MRLSENFDSVKDFMHCPCCNALDYSLTFIRRVQILRDLMEKPFYLDKTGGGFYRCRDYNSTLENSAADSRHLHGCAMDISTLGWSGSEKWFFVKQAMNLDLSVGRYGNWFHVDLRDGDPVFF